MRDHIKKNSVFGVMLMGCLLLCVHSLVAQQSQQYSLLGYQQLALNPGLSGLEGTLQVHGIYRQQWLDLEGSPSQQLMQVHLPAWYVNGGLGLSVQNDVIGARNRLAAALNYSFHLPIGRRAVLGLGTAFGFQQLELDGTQLLTPTGNYELGIDHRDPSIPSGRETGVGGFANVGAFLLGERFGIGLSMLELGVGQVQLGNYGFTQEPTFAMTANYRLAIGPALEVQPNVLVRYSGNQVQTDIAALFWYQAKYFVGGGLRGFNTTSLDAYIIQLGIQLNDRLAFAYAYDAPLSDLQSTHSGSHEVGVSYRLSRPIGKGKMPPIIYNPRLRL